MAHLFSVRSRLIALAVSLIVCLGGANLMLAQIVRAQEENNERALQRHRNIETIHSVVLAMGDYRASLGRLSSATITDGGEKAASAERAAQDALSALTIRVNSFGAFDAQSAETVRTQANALIGYMKSAIAADLADNQDETVEHVRALNEGLGIIERTLEAATTRERDRNEEARVVERASAKRALSISLSIVTASGALGVALALLLLRSIIGPLKSTVLAMRQVNDGETMVDLPPIGADEFGEMALALRQFRDQTERLRFLAYTDPLTGLGTRSRLEETLQKAIQNHQSHHACSALLFFSFDHLRNVNDSLGHRIGDRYLCEAAQRLQRFVPFGTVLCRYGGDKFAAVIEELPEGQEFNTLSDLSAISRNIVSGISEPYPYLNHMLPMAVSIGIALCPQDSESVEGLISSAESAMYEARRAGGSTIQFAKADSRAIARDRLDLISDIRRGLDAGEFEPFYQPIVDVSTQRVVAAEALLRWRHPRNGLQLPGTFIQVAEETGLIGQLGERCLIAACSQAASWQRQGLNIRVSVNLSARQIDDRAILSQLARLKTASPTQSEPIDLEITETAMLGQIEHAQATLHEIRALGYRISVDDFGTGYSSLSYVQRFPIDKIKIDRSFVSKLEQAREARAIVSTTTALAQRLDLECVAEGVETAQHVQLLREMGCYLQQGFYFSPAIPASELPQWIRKFESRFSANRA